MRKFLKKFRNPYFWTGVQTVSLALVIGSFLESEYSLKKTLIWGTILILLIGLDRMDIEKEKHEIDETE